MLFMQKTSGKRAKLFMKKNNDIILLKEEINNTKKLLDNIYSYYNEFMKSDFTVLGRKRASSIVIADTIERFYTCLETLFLRISQFFENNLDSNRWHMDLLHKMTLNINGIRKNVISNTTYNILNEILKFRHFRRYYFELEYDWDKIDFIQQKFNKIKPLIEKDLNSFISFLDSLNLH